MPRLWLTYAWRDNEDQDVDAVVVALERLDVEVILDRRKIGAGRDIWAEISAGISDARTDGWAILVSEHSLSSKPCLQELELATAEARRARDALFPLIGIFPRPIDKSLIPALLQDRLHVTLGAPDWAARIAASLSGRPPQLDLAGTPLFGMTWHRRPTVFVLEVWPRVGRWSPFHISVGTEERDLMGRLLPRPRGVLHQGGLAMSDQDYFRVTSADGLRQGTGYRGAITAETSAMTYFYALPKTVWFGDDELTYEFTPHEPGLKPGEV